MSELKEALTAANVGALIQKQIDPLLLEYQRRFSPLVRSVPSQKWGSSSYYFNTRTSRVPGGFVADGGARPVGQSVYVQNKFDVRLLQAVGSVTGYAQQVTADLIGNLRQREIEGAVQSLLWDVEAAMLWGNDGATNLGPYPQFSGLDSLVGTFSGVSQNAIDEAGATLALRHLDQLIDMVESQSAMQVFQDGWMIVASPTAISKVAQLLTNQQRFNDKVEVAAGLLVPSYRDIPLVKSSFLSARSSAMGTVTTATATTGGTLAAGAYKYQVSAVIARYGEIAASAEVSQTTTGATSTVTLSFTPPTGPDAAPPILYKVYRTLVGGATGTETLLGVVDANVGLAGDGVTPIVATSIIDNGAALVPMNGATAPASTPAAYVSGNSGALPLAASQENIYLIPKDPDLLVRPYVRDVTPLDVYPTTSAPDTLPFALVTDTTLAARAPKYLGRLARISAAL
jgi:hypothetical protein